jgi:Fuc2NAc and GlcNAc transferase
VSVLAVVAIVAAVLAWLLTGQVLRYARRRALLDVPNERSSHSAPIPRGGGLATALVASLGLPVLAFAGRLELCVALVLALAGGLVASVGWIDDRRNVPARVRFAVHVAAVALLLAGTGTLGPLTMPGLSGNPVLQSLAAAFSLVWLINLFNFMDGIDGLAGTEAVFVAAGLVACLALHAAGGSVAAAYGALLCGAACGFLAWNWPPARIFMGDVGSGFLGFGLGALALLAHRETSLNLWVPTILLGVFVTDATVTLLRRAARGERWYAAHRSHAYQWLARRHGAHRPVTIAAIGLNLLWLLPLAVLATLHPSWALPITILAYLPLVVLAWRTGAGRPE